MKGLIENRNWIEKKKRLYQSRVNKDVVSLPNCSTCCQRMRMERAAGTCVSSCVLHYCNLTRPFGGTAVGPCNAEHSVREEGGGGSGGGGGVRLTWHPHSRKRPNTLHKLWPYRLSPGAPHLSSSQGFSHIDELIRLPQVNTPVETVAAAGVGRGDWQCDFSWASPPQSVSLVCIGLYESFWVCL